MTSRHDGLQPGVEILRGCQCFRFWRVRPTGELSGRPGQMSVTATWDSVAACAPDLVVVAPCGYHLDGAIAQARAVAEKLPGIPIWAIDADGLIVRPGLRLVDGVEALAAILHPGAVPAVPGRAERVA